MRALFDDGAVRRDERLREAVRQARAVAGPDAALRVLEIDPDSRVPERRVVLTPFEPPGSRGTAEPRRVSPGPRRIARAAAGGGAAPTTAASRWRSTARRSTPSASRGSSRTAGGPTGRCAGATGRSSPTGGRNVVVFRDLVAQGWYRQR